MSFQAVRLQLEVHERVFDNQTQAALQIEVEAFEIVKLVPRF